MNHSFLPSSDSGRDLWAKNFAAKLPQYAAKYGITTAELADVQLSVLNFSYWLNYKHQLDEYNKKMTLFKNELASGSFSANTAGLPPAFPVFGTAPAPVLPGIFIRLSSYAQRIKKHLSYTPSDGKDLSIESFAMNTANLESAKPQLSVRLVKGGKPEIVWHKKNMTAIELYVDRGEGFEFLATDFIPNYTDNFSIDPGQTAVWKYKGIYLKNDERAGEFSDEIKITVTGEQ